jgi:hypothetical protein
MKVRNLRWLTRGERAAVTDKGDESGFREGGVVAAGVRSGCGRGIGANVEVEDSSRGTRGQLVGRPVEVQVAEYLFSSAERRFLLK